MFPAAGIVGHEATKCEFNRCRNTKCATSIAVISSSLRLIFYYREQV